MGGAVKLMKGNLEDDHTSPAMSHEVWQRSVRDFILASRFQCKGTIVTDLDGTAVHEYRGRLSIAEGVAHALKRLNDQGRAIVINTLRFPRNVIATFGAEWSAITNAPLPLISLNGGQTGYLVKDGAGELVFREIDARPLAASDIDELMVGVEGLVANGVDELLVFFYPRDWRVGEVVWTPVAQRLEHVREKFVSSSEVFSSDTGTLRERLRASEPCMIFLSIDRPTDDLMAYQHYQPSNFVTAAGVDKRHGLLRLAARLSIDLEACVGAGDTPMDNFLEEVGLAVLVGPLDLGFRGRLQTIRVKDSHEFGRVLKMLGESERR